MSFGQCRKCNSYISLEEYNLGKYTNIGKGGLCFPCITLELKELEQLQAESAKPITEHPDVQRLIGQVVELQLEQRALKAANQILQAENKRLKPKPLLFGNLFGFKVIINEAVPDNQIWFATQAQINEALEYSRIQLEQALKGQTHD